jgi:hypothetical protein
VIQTAGFGLQGYKNKNKVCWVLCSSHRAPYPHNIWIIVPVKVTLGLHTSQFYPEGDGQNNEQNKVILQARNRL